MNMTQRPGKKPAGEKRKAQCTENVSAKTARTGLRRSGHKTEKQTCGKSQVKYTANDIFSSLFHEFLLHSVTNRTLLLNSFYIDNEYISRTNRAGYDMFKYDRLWETMKKKGISQYDLYTHYGVSKSLLDKFRKNKNMEIYTIDRICSILDCDIEDVVEHVPDEE